MYSADKRNSLIVADSPRFNNTGLSYAPTSLSSSKFCMLRERGIRTFETQYRNTLDLAAVPTLKELSHLPVIVDPSHATGKWSLVAPMSKAAVAAGADGLLIEVHSNPECALCDGEESIKPSQFKELMQDMRKIAVAVGRDV